MDDLEPVVYTDSLVPGAPQVGDVVVVVHGWQPDEPIAIANSDPAAGHVCQVVGVWAAVWPVPYPWKVTGVLQWVHAVRRPTEAELTTWALQGATHE